MEGRYFHIETSSKSAAKLLINKKEKKYEREKPGT